MPDPYFSSLKAAATLRRRFGSRLLAGKFNTRDTSPISLANTVNGLDFIGGTHAAPTPPASTPAHADHVAGIIHGQRRRSLNYHSPTMLYAAATV